MAGKVQECIYIYFIPSDGKSWADFLHSKLSEKEYMISSSVVNINALTDDHLIHDVNIVLVSPDFLDLKSIQPLNVLHQYKSLAVLLGVTGSEYEHFLSRNRRSVLCDWDVFCTEATEVSVRQLLLRIIMLYEDVHEHDVKLREHSISFYGDEDDLYDFLPEARPIIPTQKVFQRDSALSNTKRISEISEADYDVPQLPVEDYDVPPPACSSPSSKTSEILEQDDYEVPNSNPKTVKGKETSSTLADYDRADRVVGNSLYGILQNVSDKREIFLMLGHKTKGDVIITSETGELIAKAKYLDKSLYHFTSPGQKLKAKIMSDNKLLGKCEGDFSSRASAIKISDENSRLQNLRTLLLGETDPVCVLCKALRLTETNAESLDRHLAERCKVLSEISSFQSLIQKEDRRFKDSSGEVWPTLFHFCAEFNLIKLFQTLSKVPGIVDMCKVINCDKEDPFHVAVRKEHFELATLIENYVTAKDSVGKKDSGIDCDQENRESEYMEMNEEGKNEENRESEYMEMNEQEKKQKLRKTDSGVEDTTLQESGQSEYMVMDVKPTHAETKKEEKIPPPIPPKAHKVKVRRYVNEFGYDDDDTYVAPRTNDPFLTDHLSQLHLKHSHSEGDTQHLDHLGIVAHDIDIDDVKHEREYDQVPKESSTLPGYHRAISESYIDQEHKCKSLTQESDVMLPTHKEKKGFVKRVGNFIKHIGHHEHEEKHGNEYQHRGRRGSKQHSQTLDVPGDGEHGWKLKDDKDQRSSGSSTESRTEHKKRRKSMRIHLALHDKNIKVLDIPRKSTFYDEKSTF